MNTSVNINHGDTIYVAGHRGMVGSAIVRPRIVTANPNSVRSVFKFDLTCSLTP